MYTIYDFVLLLNKHLSIAHFSFLKPVETATTQVVFADEKRLLHISNTKRLSPKHPFPSFRHSSTFDVHHSRILSIFGTKHFETPKWGHSTHAHPLPSSGIPRPRKSHLPRKFSPWTTLYGIFVNISEAYFSHECTVFKNTHSSGA